MKISGEYGEILEELNDDEKRTLTVLVFASLLAGAIAFFMGALFGLAWGTATQEQVLVDQLAIRDLNLKACYDPNAAFFLYGKGRIFSMTNLSDPDSVEKYYNYTGHMPVPPTLRP